MFWNYWSGILWYFSSQSKQREEKKQAVELANAADGAGAGTGTGGGSAAAGDAAVAGGGADGTGRGSTELTLARYSYVPHKREGEIIEGRVQTIARIWLVLG